MRTADNDLRVRQQDLRGPALCFVGRPLFEIGPSEFSSDLPRHSLRRRDLPFGKGRRRTWLGHWLIVETPLLALLNAGASLSVFALALLLLGPIGLARAVSPDFVRATSLSSARLADYAGAALLMLALLVALRSLFSQSRVRAVFVLVLAALLTLGGLWLMAAGLYAGGVPALFRPALSLAGGALAADLDYLVVAIVPSLTPALAITLGVLLSVRQIKSAAHARAARGRRILALTGLLASACTLAIGADADELRGAGIVTAPEVSAPSPARASAYAPPFAPGVPCHISDAFGERRNPFDTSHYEFHPGVDMAVAWGTPVHAMAGGTVIFAGNGGGFGNMVAVRASDGSESPPVIVEGHMERLFVSRGALVRAGDVVGLAGSTGRSTGPHLHLQICTLGRTNRFGGFVCGTAQNPYERWRALSAIARASCARGPIVPQSDLVSWLGRMLVTEAEARTP